MVLLPERPARTPPRRATVRSPELARRLGQIRSLPAPVVDTGLAVIFLGLVVVERLRNPLPFGWLAVIAPVLTLVLAVSLALRRRVPFTAFATSTVALCLESLLHILSAFSPLSNQVCVYSVAAYASRARARLAAPLVPIGVLLYFVGTPGLHQSNPADVIEIILVWLATWAVGYSVARRREDQDRARRAIAGQVVAEERVRISRELHDLVGHTVNLLVVQAGAARLMLDKDPAITRELLTGMERTGRETLADLDQVLATLRPDPAEPGMDNNPSSHPLGLAQLPELVDRFTESGIDVKLTVDPTLRLPQKLDLSIYRVVQEALTNTLKHAAPCSAEVDVRREDRSVVVEVSDNGPGPREPRLSGGRGLLGMAERVSMCGGVLEHGGGEGGGFRLRAALPLP
jgi:signal transduction histidine kinase